MLKLIHIYLSILIFFISVSANAQCTEANDDDMRRYNDFTETKDAQGCSECAMLALYRCSALYCVSAEDKRRVKAMIAACKRNIKQMGDPVCCPLLLNKPEPIFGSKAGKNGNASNSSSGDEPSQVANGMIDQDGIMLQQKIEQGMASYYAAEAVDNARTKVQNNSELSGNYNTAKELEAEFNQKYQVLSNSIEELNDAENQSLQENYNLLYSNSSDIDPAVGQAVVDVIGLINSSQVETEKKEAFARLEQQKKEALIKIEQKKQAIRIEMRRKLFTQFPEGGVPLSSHKTKAKELYFFVYIFKKPTLENREPKIQVSKVFPIAQYNDKTWPYKIVLLNEISKFSQGGNITLVGYYNSLEMANEMQTSFLNMAAKSEMVIDPFIYKGKPISSNYPKVQNEDFWGTQIKTSTPGNQNNKQTGKNKLKQGKMDSQQTETEFWGAPIEKK